MRYKLIILSLALSLAFGVLEPDGSEVSFAVARGSDNPMVRIGVLGLFHPRELTLRAAAGKTLLLRAGTEKLVLEGNSVFDSANFRVSRTQVAISSRGREVETSAVAVAGRDNEPADFVISIPGKISRHYFGVLEVKPQNETLTVIVSMDRETAVASVISAESASDTPLEALKAQAIATRSYLVAGRGRHLDFEFCDTTHCQFLREPPPPRSSAARAVAETRGLVLTYNSQPFAAMYTRSCSGHTRTPSQVGFSAQAYPYYSVDCQYCLSHPFQWTARLSGIESQRLGHNDESARLNVNRRLGWETVPSNDFTSHRDADSVLLQGIGNGHGIGLCQSGAKAMAEHGASYQEILGHYYPNGRISEWHDPLNNRERANSTGHLN